MSIELYLGDCLDIMHQIPSKSIDMILCDLPYGVTHNSWDTPIDLNKLWKEYSRLIKDNGAIVLFGQGMFTAKLMLSSKYWRYNLIWNKVLTSGFLNAHRQPLRSHEDICVFYKKQPTYNPQKVMGKPNHSRGRADKPITNNNYGNMKFSDLDLGGEKFPKSIITIQRTPPSNRTHPTEKPVELMEWLIKTYTDEGQTVLDNCIGCGATAVACKNTNRNCIGIEINKEYYNIAKKRINGII